MPKRPTYPYETSTGHLMTVQQVLNVALAHRNTLTQGSVVLQGREPLFQATFVSALLQACGESGLRTEMITSGAGSGRVNDRMLREIDLTTISLPARAGWSNPDELDALKLADRLQNLGRAIRLQLPVVDARPFDPDHRAALTHALSGRTGLQSVEIYDCQDLAAVPPSGLRHRYMASGGPVSAAALQLKQDLLNAGVWVE
ncbi:hypothetical protein [Kineosporia sp. NBRC 101731]|uniref:hypothetical protein n=1 Tax=Kineosporia sp. NBRC 101731 TaxID=3032199 RepID=UPI0025565C36|nr:hypothetical protein [Kineosporia sp. NBRC 101731]